MKPITTQELIDELRRELKRELDKMHPDARNVRYLTTSLVRLESLARQEWEEQQEANQHPLL
jgi:hypothetical protein